MYLHNKQTDHLANQFYKYLLNIFIAILLIFSYHLDVQFGENQRHEISLFIMASYDIDTFSRFVFESSMLKRFKVEKNTVDLIRSNQMELLKFAMIWLQFSLFGEGSFAEKMKVKK